MIGLAERLRQDGIERLWVGGLAQDVCVEATALGAREAGFDVHVLLDATKPITKEGGEKALETMRKAGILIEESVD